MALINWTNVTDLVSLGASANTSSDGFFWVGLLFAIWIILTIMNLGAGWETALLVSSFASLILGFFLVYLNYISWYYGAIFLGIILIVIFMISFNQKSQT